MPYIGNTIRAADDYRLIDDISSGFNGSATSFALQVAGSAPVPFPKSPQQVLISVNGVIQEPDPTGASGFNLVGTNIVFSSAPTNGHAFFGIIYATADYLNAGGNFPAGSLGAPSITFIGDENTGLFRKSGGSVGFVSDATEIANFDSNGITISSGNIIIPDSIIHNGDTNTKIRFPAADTVSFETAGNEALRVDSSGRLLIGTTAARVDRNGFAASLQVEGTSTADSSVIIARNSNNASSSNLIFQKSRGASVGSNTVIQNNDVVGTIIFEGSDGTNTDSLASIIGACDGTPGTNDVPGRLVFSTTADGAANPTERMRIGSNGDVTVNFDGSGNQTGQLLIADGTASACGLSFWADGSNDTGIFRVGANTLGFSTGGSERARIDSSGRLLVGTTDTPSKLVADTDFCVVRSSSDPTINLLLGSSSSITQLYRILIDDSDSDKLQIRSGDTPRVTMTTGGFVGIGQTNPSQPLHVLSTTNPAILARNDSGGTGIRMQTDAGSACSLSFSDLDAHNRGLILYHHADDRMQFNTAGTERIRIDSSGKVLIGTTSADTGKVVIEGSLTAESDPSDTAGYHLVIRSQTNSNTSKVGIALKNSSDSTSVGAAILHHRTGGGSVGDLAFYTSPSDGTTTERTKISSVGTLLHGSGAIATPKASPGGLDIACNNYSIIFGADSNSGNNTQARTNNVPKDQRIGAVHYTNAEQPVGVVRVYSDSTTNQVYIGGGSSLFNAATSLRFFTAANNTTTNGSEAMRIRSNGNVGIGTTNPGQRLEVRQTAASHAIIAVNRPNSDTFCCALGNTSNSDAVVSSNNADLIFGRDLAGTFSERFRMKNDGRVSFGNSNPPNGVSGAITFVGFTSRNGTNGNNTANLHNFQWTGSALNAFVDSTNMGEIRNSASDYRIKRNIQTQTESGIDKIKQLRCVTYSPADYTGEGGTSWSVASDEVKEGFIAHEVAAIIPSGVSGTKDDPNRIQQLNIDAIVSVLTKALQEEIAKREALETRIAALEAA